jgi:hypothetical protein
VHVELAITLCGDSPRIANLAKYNIMKWFRKKKSKSVGHADQHTVDVYPRFAQGLGSPLERPTQASARIVAQLPTAVLQCIFGYVCPHSQDESYESCEGSAVEDTCPLCDLRDLAHCAQVSRRWRQTANSVL